MKLHAFFLVFFSKNWLRTLRFGDDILKSKSKNGFNNSQRENYFKIVTSSVFYLY